MWLWKPYIPLGKVTLLQAEFSEIITSFLTGFLSEVSKGGNTPDGNQFGRPYKIIYQSSLSRNKKIIGPIPISDEGSGREE